MSRRLAVLSIIVVGALVGACADEPTAPSAVPVAGLAGPGSTIGLPTMKSNAAKYRDAGKKAATGRSGSASLTARALIGRDGRTTLEVSTGALDGAAAAPGNIDKVQVKLLENTKVGRQVYVRNFAGLTAGGTWSHVLPAGSGRTVQVLANVSGIDANRNDVVVLREKVKRRPDLRIDDLQAPAKAAPGAPVTIAAVVSELNGDVGARANCVLYVDKVESDRANGIWVDAGRSVSCAFSHRFAQAGTHAVRVEVESVKPGDWDLVNNAAVASVVVEQSSEALSYEALVEDFRRSYYWKSEVNEIYEERSGYSSTTRTGSDDTRNFRHRLAVMKNYTSWKADGSVAFPLRRLDVSHASGTLASSATFTDLGSVRFDTETEPGQYERERRCADGYADGTLGRVMIEACVVRMRNLSSVASAGDPPADGQWYSRLEVESTHFPGDVTYISQRQFQRLNVVGDPTFSGCTDAGPDGNDYCYFYVFNSSEPPGASGELPALGASYSMGLVVAAADGAAQEARADVALDQPYRPFPLADGSFTDRVESRICSTVSTDESEWTLYGYRYTYSECVDQREEASGRSGFVSRLQQPAVTP